jgi:hypothetical protein
MATFEEKRLVAETIHGELARELISQWRGIAHANKFSIKVPVNIRAFDAIFWPGPSASDIAGRAGCHQYEKSRFPPEFFPADWDCAIHR